MSGVWPPGTMRPCGVYVCAWREGEKDRRSLGQGRGWKAALLPAEHGGRGGSPLAGKGVLSDALIETSDTTKTGLTGQLNGVAVTEQLSSPSHTYTSLSAVVTPGAPFFLIHAISLVALTYFISQCCGSVWCVRVWCVCPHSWQGAIWNFTSMKQKA